LTLPEGQDSFLLNGFATRQFEFRLPRTLNRTLN